MKQYCRYCCYLCTGNGAIWCDEKSREISETAAKSPNKCHSFAYTPIDVFRYEKEYKPREPKKPRELKKTSSGKQCDGQMSLVFEMEDRVMENQKRLTWENNSGEWGLNDYDIKRVSKELMGAINKLKDYEKSGLDPNQLKEIDVEFSKQAKELMYYRGLKKKGLLFAFPCKAGDVLYRIDTDPKIFCECPVPHTVSSIEICEYDKVLFLDYARKPICDLESLQNGTPYMDYYMVFLTYDEAQKALEKLMENRTGQQP